MAAVRQVCIEAWRRAGMRLEKECVSVCVCICMCAHERERERERERMN